MAAASDLDLAAPDPNAEDGPPKCDGGARRAARGKSQEDRRDGKPLYASLDDAQKHKSSRLDECWRPSAGALPMEVKHLRIGDRSARTLGLRGGPRRSGISQGAGVCRRSPSHAALSRARPPAALRSEPSRSLRQRPGDGAHAELFRRAVEHSLGCSNFRLTNVLAASTSMITVLFRSTRQSSE
jgi:hypothetical protein